MAPPANTFAQACANIIAGTAALGGIGGVITGSTNFLQSYLTEECFICDQTVTRREIKEHVYKHRGLVEKCRICDKAITVHDFEGHMDIHRKEKEEEDKGKEQQLDYVECQVCGINVDSQKMELHMSYHGRVLAAMESKDEINITAPPQANIGIGIRRRKVNRSGEHMW